MRHHLITAALAFALWFGAMSTVQAVEPILGEWKGQVNEPAGAYEGIMTLTSPRLGTSSYPLLDCGGLLFGEIIDGVHHFDEIITRGRETCADGHITMIVRGDSMAWLWCFERIELNGHWVCNGSAVYALGTLYRDAGGKSEAAPE